MYRVVDEWHTNRFAVLTLDKPIEGKTYFHFKIDGKIYDVVPVYGLPGCIAVESDESFIGKTVEVL